MELLPIQKKIIFNMKQSELCIANKARVRVEKRFLFDYNIA